MIDELEPLDDQPRAIKTKRKPRLFHSHKRCPRCGRAHLFDEWESRGMCPVCWAADHPLAGYCMLCGEPLHRIKAQGLCPKCDQELRDTFARDCSKVKIPITTLDEVRYIIAFAAMKIYSNLDSLERLARKTKPA